MRKQQVPYAIVNYGGTLGKLNRAISFNLDGHYTHIFETEKSRISTHKGSVGVTPSVNFEITPYFKITAEFDVKGTDGKNVVLKAESPTRFNDENGAESFLKNCIGANFNIRDIQVKPAKRRPAAPFTTSTLQQEALGGPSSWSF